MSCYHPIKGFRTSSGVVFSELRHVGDILGDIALPCGQCIGCRMDRAQDWTTRCMHEASMWSQNCFVTLTYGRDKMPPGGSLDHRDVQLFLKRLRKRFGPLIRFYMCGEYGPQTNRPHYHVCLFGVDFPDREYRGKSKSGHKMFTSKILEDLWGHGHVTVQDLTPETASYAARYIMKKQLGKDSQNAYDLVTPDGVVVKRKAEYSAMSLKPGIGEYWFRVHGAATFAHDYVVVDGKKRPVPAYYDVLQDRSFRAGRDLNVQYRLDKAALHREDQTDERLAVRELVHEAKVRTLTRGDCNDASE